MLLHARQSANTLGITLQRIWSTLYLSYAECDARRIDSAHDHAQEALNDARACRMQLSESQALRRLARVSAKGESQDSEEPQNLWRQSIEIATRCGATPSAGQAQPELGVHFAEIGKEGEAHDLINAALEAFRRMGMPHWVKKTEQAASAWTLRE